MGVGSTAAVGASGAGVGGIGGLRNVNFIVYSPWLGADLSANALSLFLCYEPGKKIPCDECNVFHITFVTIAIACQVLHWPRPWAAAEISED